MLENVLPILCAVLLAYLTYILVRAYRPDLFRTSVTSNPGSAPSLGSALSSGSVDESVDESALVEPFAGKAMGTPSASPLNTPSQPIPSAAPPHTRV